MEETKTRFENDFIDNQVAIQFKHYVINMILLFIFFGIIFYIIVDIISDFQKARLIKFNLRYKLK